MPYQPTEQNELLHAKHITFYYRIVLNQRICIACASSCKRRVVTSIWAWYSGSGCAKGMRTPQAWQCRCLAPDTGTYAHCCRGHHSISSCTDCKGEIDNSIEVSYQTGLALWHSGPSQNPQPALLRTSQKPGSHCHLCYIALRGSISQQHTRLLRPIGWC